jgi:hypothetical protein
MVHTIQTAPTRRRTGEVNLLPSSFLPNGFGWDSCAVVSRFLGWDVSRGVGSDRIQQNGSVMTNLPQSRIVGSFPRPLEPGLQVTDNSVFQASRGLSAACGTTGCEF